VNYKILGSTAAGGALGVALVALCFFVGTGPEVRALNLAVLIAAASTGWLVGVLVSPYDAREAQTFPKYAATVSAFASGYLVSKLDRVLEEILKPEFLFSSVVGFRVLAGIAAFATALLITYVYRAYAR
jgi:hypothetical protein